MCIRDRTTTARPPALAGGLRSQAGPRRGRAGPPPGRDRGCLLYTSDAADERSSVDLGGRRIIKKKKTQRDTGNGAKRNEIDEAPKW